MRGALLVVLLALLAASCGDDAGLVGTTTAAPGSTTTATSTTTTTTGPSTTATTTGPSTTATSSAHSWAGRLVGTEVWGGEWDEGGQLRLLQGDAVGSLPLWISLEACLSAPGDTCSWRLLFAARPTDPPEALASGYYGFIALVRAQERAGAEVLEVVAAVDVALPPGAGTAAMLGSSDQGPFWAAELGFTAAGLVVRRVWRPDVEVGALVAEDPSAEGLPDLSAWVGAGQVVGRVVTGRAYTAAPEDPYRTLDLSGAAPTLLPGFWEAAGRWIPGGGSLLWQAAAPEGLPQAVWLTQFLGWSYAGTALWRVRDAVEFAEASGATGGNFCSHEPSGAEAIALVASGVCGDCPVVSAEAFRVNLIDWEFEPVPPGEVVCTCCWD